MTKVFSFSSGKGGVGKTTMVANLGHLWAQSGKKVLLIDADWSLGKLGIALNVRPKHTIESVLSGRVSMKEALVPVSENCFLLGSPSGIVGFESLTESYRNQLFFEIEKLASEFDCVLLDHSSGVDWDVLQFAAAAHRHVVLTTTEPTSFMDAYAIMKILSKRFQIREFGLVVTMVDSEAEEKTSIPGFLEFVRNELLVRVDALGVIHWESRLRESNRKQRLFVQDWPESRVSAELEQVAKRLETSRLSANHGLQFLYQQTASILTR